jgi:hypothetical protein
MEVLKGKEVYTIHGKGTVVDVFSDKTMCVKLKSGRGVILSPEEVFYQGGQPRSLRTRYLKYRLDHAMSA